MSTSQKSRAVAAVALDAASGPGSAARSKRGGELTVASSGADSEAIASLRRQVVALQRISSLGVLAGGVFHELNNALTPILSYAKLGLRNPDPAYRERALTQIVEGGRSGRPRSPGACSACRGRAAAWITASRPSWSDWCAR